MPSAATRAAQGWRRIWAEAKSTSGMSRSDVSDGSRGFRSIFMAFPLMCRGAACADEPDGVVDQFDVVH
jgi:hypothetical protein